MDNLQIFSNSEFGEIKEIEKRNKDKYTGYAYIVDIMSNLDSALAIDGEIKKVAEKYGKSKDSIGSAVRNAVKTANHSLEVWKNYDCLTTKGFLTTMYYRTREESANE